jgi:hypothetical protein
MISIDPRRGDVLREALTWTGTPFVWEACIKGVGVDCGRFLAASFNGAGVKHIDIKSFPRFSPQWFLHKRDDEPSPFLEQLQRFAVEYKLGDTGKKTPAPADLIVAKMGRDWAHSALVVAWPHVIACLSGFCVAEYQDIHRAPQFGTRQFRFLDPFDPKAGGS